MNKTNDIHELKPRLMETVIAPAGFSAEGLEIEWKLTGISRRTFELYHDDNGLEVTLKCRMRKDDGREFWRDGKGTLYYCQKRNK